MTTKTIPGSDFFKSLGRLEALAHGGNTEEQPGDMSKAQLFHTPSDSNPKTWPGGDTTEYGKWEDSIGADGTDYHPARKSIAEKALKGLPLSPEEIAILKSDIEQNVIKAQECPEEDKEDKEEDKKAMKKVAKKAMKEAMKAFGGSKMTFKAQKDDDEKPSAEEKDIGKSFEAAVGQSETLQKGIELSGFLADFAKAFGVGLEGVGARTTNAVEQATNAILQQVGSYLDARFAEQAEFNKSLADAIVNIGHGVAGNLEQISQVAQAPAGPPRSQLRAVPAGVQAVQKSFAGGQGETLSKAQKLDVMVDLVEKGQLNSLEVCKFESTNQLRPEVEALVMQHIQSGGNK
jgi:hypothetical protein